MADKCLLHVIYPGGKAAAASVGDVRITPVSCQSWSLEWAAPTGTQPCTVFGYKDFCESTVLGTPKSVGMNGQID